MRKTKLDDIRKERILQGIKQGLTQERSAIAAGITERTFYNWIERGEKDTSGIFFQLFQDLKKAEAEGELNLLKTIQDASKHTWQAAAWILERRFPSRWARPKQTEPERNDVNNLADFFRQLDEKDDDKDAERSVIILPDNL